MSKKEYSTIAVGGLDRRFVLHVPPCYDGTTPAPLVVTLHGAGGTSYDAIRQTGWSDKSDQEGFIAVYPEAVTPDKSKPGRLVSNMSKWNDGSGSGYAFEQGVDDVRFIRELIEYLQSKYVIDNRRIFITGFSNGGAMTMRLGVELSDIISCIASIAGHFYPSNLKLSYPVSLLFIIGSEDTLVPVDGGAVTLPWGEIEVRPPVAEWISSWRKLLNCSDVLEISQLNDSVTMMRYSGYPSGAEIEYYQIAGAGHVWPGGVNILNERISGPSTDKLDATKVMWEFFTKHPRV